MCAIRRRRVHRLLRRLGGDSRAGAARRARNHPRWTSDRPIGSARRARAERHVGDQRRFGRFRIEISHRNRVVLDVRRVGFMPSRVGVDEGGDTTVSVLLLPLTQRLPTVEVTNTATRPPSLAGFEERMRDRKKGAGVGTFITDRDIEKMNAMRVTQAFENVPSVFAAARLGRPVCPVRQDDGRRRRLSGRHFPRWNSHQSCRRVHRRPSRSNDEHPARWRDLDRRLRPADGGRRAGDLSARHARAAAATARRRLRAR